MALAKRGLEVAFVTALLVGVLAGYFGAILPGPVNVSVLRKALQNQVRAARLLAVGAALMDALFCAAIGLGVAWFEAVMRQPVVRLLLAIFLSGYGLKIMLLDGRRDLLREAATREPPSAPPPEEAIPTAKAFDLSVFIGALQGAANPALIVNWTVIIGFLVAHGMVRANAAGSLGFAVGVGCGCFGWLSSVIWLLKRSASSPIMRWWRRSTVFGGGALVLLGAYFAFVTLRDM